MASVDAYSFPDTSESGEVMSEKRGHCCATSSDLARVQQQRLGYIGLVSSSHEQSAGPRQRYSCVDPTTGNYSASCVQEYLLPCQSDLNSPPTTRQALVFSLGAEFMLLLPALRLGSSVIRPIASSCQSGCPDPELSSAGHEQQSPCHLHLLLMKSPPKAGWPITWL